MHEDTILTNILIVAGLLFVAALSAIAVKKGSLSLHHRPADRRNPDWLSVFTRGNDGTHARGTINPGYHSFSDIADTVVRGLDQYQFEDAFP